jgi:hypothetical protein
LRKRWRVSASRGALAHPWKPHLPRAWQQRVQDPFLGGVRRACLDLRLFLFARHLHCDVGQILDDGVDLASDVADLGELGRLDLHERRLRQARQATRDLGLAAAGRSDHQDVLRRDLVAQRLVDLHAAPAVAQGNGHRAFRCLLADDVLVQFQDDLARSHLPSSSIVRLRLV